VVGRCPEAENEQLNSFILQICFITDLYMLCALLLFILIKAEQNVIIGKWPSAVYEDISHHVLFEGAFVRLPNILALDNTIFEKMRMKKQNHFNPNHESG
jgi:hypothetical protein